ncbi:hypothetical protein B9Z50_05810 [Limnohabitans sp. Bal53]|nr:hypothetical protein B9Z50_05810 [Limnohabitans sp. Bal53]
MWALRLPSGAENSARQFSLACSGQGLLVGRSGIGAAHHTGGLALQKGLVVVLQELLGGHESLLMEG